MPRKQYILGTRKSALALWQANFIKRSLEGARSGVTIEIMTIETTGDKQLEEALPDIGGKGVFTLELEESLRRQEIDFAQHSLKDLPTTMSAEFVIGAVCERESPYDVLVSRAGEDLSELRHRAVVGTSSIRRSAQLLHQRPDLETRSIRGNIDTRLKKLHDRELGFDAIVLAESGISRMGRGSEISQRFLAREMLPAPGQGAIALQCFAENADAVELAGLLHHAPSAAEVRAERMFLHVLEAGCSAPVGALARVKGTTLEMTGACFAPDGSAQIEVSGSDVLENADLLGRRLAEEALEKGADELMRNRDGQ